MGQDPEQAPWRAARTGGIAALTCWHRPGGGPMLASAGTDGTVRVWDASTGGTAAAPFVGHTAAVWALTSWSTSAGGPRVASSGTDGTIRIWDPEREAAATEHIQGHTHRVEALVSWVTPAGGVRLASGDATGVIRVWDAATGRLVTELDAGNRTRVGALACWTLLDGTARLASSDAGGAIQIWDVESGRGAVVIEGHAGGVWGLSGWVLPDGTERLAAGGEDHAIRIWDPRTGELVCGPLSGHRGRIGGLVSWTTPGGAGRLASAGHDGTVRVWDAETGGAIASSGDLHAGRVEALARWASTGGERTLLASAASDGVIRVWDAETGTPTTPALAGHAAGVWSLATWIDPDGSVRLASGGQDGTVRVWDTESGAAVGSGLSGHTGGVWVLHSWTAWDGRVRLASAGHDGAVLVWDVGRVAQSRHSDPDTTLLAAGTGFHSGRQSWSLTHWSSDRAEVLAVGFDDGTIRCWEVGDENSAGRTLTRHTGRVGALASWRTPRGEPRLASAGHDGVVLLWNPVSGVALGSPLDCDGTRLRALQLVSTADGATLLAAAGDDGRIHLWDPETGARHRAPMPAHDGPIRALTSWRTPAGGTLLASAGYDAAIRIWDVHTGRATGAALRGHTAALQALTSWTTPDGTTRLASAGYDGTIRLWDPNTGTALRTIELGPVTLWALSDAPARVDLLGRDLLARAVVDQLRRPGADAATDGPGPTVITVEGPWGCGKSTLMGLIRDRLPAATLTQPAASRQAATPARRRRPRPLTVREAQRLTRGHDPAPAPVVLPAGPERGMVSAWFNPWAHQSGEQVWAGLTDAIISAAAPVLYPSPAGRERYWFTHNLPRIDRFGLARTLRRRVVSPLLGLAVVVAVLPVAATLAGVDGSVTVLGYSFPPLLVGLGFTLGFLLAGALHTGLRHRYGRASDYLPGELFHRPISGDVDVDGTGGQSETVDPLRRARAGSLYLYQHDIGEILADLNRSGNDLVLFVDDLDRCGTETTAEVIEAVNLFLAGFTSDGEMRARFVIGLDPDIVAAHLDDAHAALNAGHLAQHGDDPSLGWAYLRKFVQLPVPVPRITDAGVDSFVERVASDGGDGVPGGPGALDRDGGPGERAAAAWDGLAAGDGSTVRPEARSGNRAAVPAEAMTRVRTVAWRSTERHPRVRAFLRERLLAQPDRSIREFKRLLNVWQLYERLLAVRQPLDQPEASIRRTCQLILLAEITTRWPALRRYLNRRLPGGRHGLALLAGTAGDDAAWAAAVRELDIGPGHDRALRNLRELLNAHDAGTLAELATALL